jgi:uncharacterized protein YlaI
MPECKICNKNEAKQINYKKLSTGAIYNKYTTTYVCTACKTIYEIIEIRKINITGSIDDTLLKQQTFEV